MLINLILSLLIVTTSCFTSIANVGSSDGYSIDVNLTETSPDVYSFDIKNTLPGSIMDAGQISVFLWIDTGQSDYTLTSDTNQMNTFGIAMQWNFVCNGPSDFFGPEYYSGTADYISSDGRFSTNGGTTYRFEPTFSDFYEDSADPFAPIYGYSITGITTTDLASIYKLPNKEETSYLKCFSDFNSSAYSVNLDYTDVADNLPTQANALLGMVPIVPPDASPPVGNDIPTGDGQRWVLGR